MKKNIGEVIRSLRKENQMTQEKLAEALGVSFQSVSRWENGLAYPDITLVPIIARFFNVSTDTLFDINNEDLQKLHSNLEVDFLQSRSAGNTENCITIMQEARKEFPRDYHFMMNLAESLKNMRAARNLSLAEFSRELDIPKSTLQCGLPRLCIPHRYAP